MPLYPPDVANALSAAYGSFDKRDFGTALEACEDILREHPGNFEARYLAGLATWKAGDPIMANRYIDDACKAFPDIHEYERMLKPLGQRGKTDTFTFLRNRLKLFNYVSSLDGVVISYPKCGRTWLRAMVGHYLLRNRPGDPLEVRTITSKSGLPVVDFFHDDYPHWKPLGLLQDNKKMYADARVVFLARDPRDVLVSYYFQYTRRGDKVFADDASFDGTMSDFIRHPIGGLGSLVGFYNIWAERRDAPAQFLLQTYEDYHSDTAAQLAELIRFLGLPDHGRDAIAEAVRFGSFDNMREMEETDALDNARLRPPEDGDPEGFKVRIGKVGGYTDYLTPEDIAYIDSFLDGELDDLFAAYKS